jgi:TRAP-type mannitol/chloroaromatic compound transport system permease small subunit
MPEAIKKYVRYVDAMNRFIGLGVTYMIFAMMAVLLYASFMKTFFLPSLWTLEFAQFMMVAYFLLGGAFSMQEEGHVRMDLLYGNYKPKTQAAIDVVTVFFLLVYLGFLIYGGVSSTAYALQYGETSHSAWDPHMAPIKIIMLIGIVMMLLQSVSSLFKDIAKVRGMDIS